MGAFAVAAKLIGAVAAAASAATTAVGEIAAYHPLVLGGIKDPASDRIAWVAIAQWTWWPAERHARQAHSQRD